MPPEGAVLGESLVGPGEGGAVPGMEFRQEGVVCLEEAQLLSIHKKERGRRLGDEVCQSHRVKDRALQLVLHPIGPHVQEDLRKGHGLCIVVALDPLAPDGAQKVDLLPGLHSLREGVHSKILCHAHQICEDRAALFVELLEKAHVELDEVKGKAVQRIERGVLGAEVVEPDLMARLVEPVNHPVHLLPVFRNHPLCDLTADAVRRNLIGITRLCHALLGLNQGKVQA